MELIISLLMGTRLLTLLGGGLGNEAAPYFLPPRIILSSEEVRLDCYLSNAFPRELRKLATTATPIVMYVIVELRAAGERQPVRKSIIETRLVYDMIAKQYCVTTSVSRDTVCTRSLDTSIRTATSLKNVLLARKKSLTPDKRYTVSLQAILGKTRVEALDDKEIDCMYYWDFKRPGLKTETIPGKKLITQP
ncbi:MAG: DUF4390 domain-containing protein [Chitinispirillaceae bacterium]|nr:DUF4390 domain-containing protein [Chitinispirillaceae bacterium]